MFSSGATGGSKKQRPTTGYLVRPRLGALRSLYSSKPLSAYSSDKRKKLKKSALPKMDFRRKPDYADTAYREAVGRLRILLAESYAPIRRPVRELDSAGEETDNQSLISAGSRNSRPGRSYYHYNPISLRRYHCYPPLRSNTYNVLPNETEKAIPDPPKNENKSAPPELMSFIERQEEYIEQLEKESSFCRAELSSLLSKVKDVISENENLHEKQKSKLISSVFDHLETETETETEIENRKLSKPPHLSKKRTIEGPSIVFESRISELEAQLTQARIDLKKTLDENESYKRKINDGTILETTGYESYKKQIDNLQREKESLQETVNKLQNALSLLRDKENDTCDKVKRSLDVAEQAQYEKNAAEAEIRRLKDELERQHLKLRDAISDQGRRIADERSAVERRYTQQIEQLTAELGVQWEMTNKLQLELDKQRRENGDLRREVTQKQALIDELKKDMQSKIITLQTDIGVSGAEKSALEQQIATLQMANERTERQSKQEVGRLHAEIQSLRQRLDRADADLIHSRRENIRLNEQVASLEKEITLNAALSEERSKTPRSGEIVALPPPAQKKEDREKELTSMIQDMENKHAATVAELESMIYSQNQLMDKLSTECQALTQKLDDASVKHKEEIRELQTSLKYLDTRFSQSQLPTSSKKDEEYASGDNQKSTPQPVRNQQEQEKLNHDSYKLPSRQNSKDTFQHSTLPPHQQPQQTTNNQKPLSTSQATPINTFPQEQQSKDDQQKSNNGKQLQKQQIQQQKPQQAQIEQQHEQPIATEEYTESEQKEYQSEFDNEYPQQYDDNTAEYDPNQSYINPQYATNEEYDPNQQYDPNQGYDLNQGYDPNQQFTGYEGDLNQDYTQGSNDPNQQYTIDPNNDNNYATDPNYPNEPILVNPNTPNERYDGESAFSNQEYTDFNATGGNPNTETVTKQ